MKHYIDKFNKRYCFTDLLLALVEALEKLVEIKKKKLIK